MKRFLTISGLTFILAIVLYFSFPGRLIDMKIYDIYSCIRGTTPLPDDIVIIGINEESFSHETSMAMAQECPRETHKNIEKLWSEGDYHGYHLL